MTIVFCGARLHCGDGRFFDPGELWIQDERILYAGPVRSDRPEDAILRDVSGLHLCPGFVDAHTHVGLMPEGFANESKDLNEMTSPLTPGLKAIDGVWPGDRAFARALLAGVTTVCVLPGSGNAIGGQGVVLSTRGSDVESMDRGAPPCLKIALGYGVKHSHGLKGHAPLTRMAIADLLRHAFEDALIYEQNRAVDACRIDPAKEILVAALQRRAVVRAHCMRSDDIATALRLAREFGLSLVLEHALASDALIEKIVAARASVVFGPTWKTPGVSDETLADESTVLRLFEAGVPVALMTDHPIVPVGYLPLLAGLCVRAGLSSENALTLITSNAAKILGISDRLGTLGEGLLGDFLLLDGPPLEVASRVLEVWMAGQKCDLPGRLPVPGQPW